MMTHASVKTCIGTACVQHHCLFLFLVPPVVPRPRPCANTSCVPFLFEVVPLVVIVSLGVLCARAPLLLVFSTVFSVRCPLSSVQCSALDALCLRHSLQVCTCSVHCGFTGVNFEVCRVHCAVHSAHQGSNIRRICVPVFLSRLWWVSGVGACPDA